MGTVLAHKTENSPVYSKRNWDEWAEAASLKRGSDAALALLVSGVKDWEKWLAEGIRLGLAGPVWVALRDAGIQSLLPPAVADKLETGWRDASAGVPKASTALKSAAEALTEEKIPYLLLNLPGTEDFLSAPAERSVLAHVMLRIPYECQKQARDALQAASWKLLDLDGVLPSFYPDSFVNPAHPDIVLHLTFRVLIVSDLTESESLVGQTSMQPYLHMDIPVPLPHAQALLASLRAVAEGALDDPFRLLELKRLYSRLDRQGWDALLEATVRTTSVPEVQIVLSALVSRLAFAIPAQISGALEKKQSSRFVQRLILASASSASPPAARAMYVLWRTPIGDDRRELLDLLLFRRIRALPPQLAGTYEGRLLTEGMRGAVKIVKELFRPGR